MTNDLFPCSLIRKLSINLSTFLPSSKVENDFSASLPARSVMSDSLRPHWLEPARLLCPWNFPDKNIGVGCHFLLWGIFLTQGWSLHLVHLLQMIQWSSNLHIFIMSNFRYLFLCVRANWSSFSMNSSTLLPIFLLGCCSVSGESCIWCTCYRVHIWRSLCTSSVTSANYLTLPAWIFQLCNGVSNNSASQGWYTASLNSF